MIPWSDFLNFLEWQTVHLAAPKTCFAQGIILSGDIPIFATSIGMVQFVGKSNYVQRGNAMMAARWKEVKFKAPIPIEKQKNLESWARSFSELISTGAEIKRDRNPHLKLFQTGNTSNARVTIWVTVPLSWFPCISAPNITGNTGNRQYIKNNVTWEERP